MIIRALLLFLVLLGTAQAQEGSAARIVIADPARDRDHPARSAQLQIPSHGSILNGLIYQPAGTGPFPTLILLHGFPGNEQNLDLAQAVRRAGWNVVTLHYRGSWGSPGKFSIAHVLEDVDAVMEFMRRPEIAQRFQIDRDHLVLGGHSMGGFASAAHARRDKGLIGVILLDPWNVGFDGARFAAMDDKARDQAADQQFDDLGHSLQGTSAHRIGTEIAAHAGDWDMVQWAPQLAALPVLVVCANSYFAPSCLKLQDGIAQAGGKISAVSIDSDHSFQDQRPALADVVTRWLHDLWPQQTADDRAAAERYITGSEAEWAGQSVSNDTAILRRILADDYIGVSSENRVVTKADQIHDAETAPSPSDFISNTLDDCHVHFIRDDLAIAQGHESWVLRNGTKGSYIWVDTWLRRQGRWQIVASQDNKVPQP